MAYDKTNKFSLFKNDYQREGKNDPNLRGELNVDGVEYYINAWTGVTKNGEKYLSGGIRIKDTSESPKKKEPPLDGTANTSSDLDDDIPF